MHTGKGKWRDALAGWLSNPVPADAVAAGVDGDPLMADGTGHRPPMCFVGPADDVAADTMDEGLVEPLGVVEAEYLRDGGPGDASFVEPTP